MGRITLNHAGIRPLRATLSMIKFQHTLFALPFAFTGAALAAGGAPTQRQIGWIVGAMVGARSAAMVWNRIADLHRRNVPLKEQRRGGVRNAVHRWRLRTVESCQCVSAYLGEWPRA